jgi:hypothetical protein
LVGWELDGFGRVEGVDRKKTGSRFEVKEVLG